ncbi:MAG TPA: hypothetical protein VN963_01185 [bacterium]|nr:hypothetical protein [bacterium]
MKTYLTAVLLTFTFAVSALAQTAGDNNPKSPNRHHTRPPYSGHSKHHKIFRPELYKSGTPNAKQMKPKSDHVVAH